MRFKGLLLSHAESRKVVAEVDAWCRRTGTNYNKLIVAAGVAPSLRSDVRCRGRKLTTMTAQKLRRTMLQFGAGISRAQHKEHLGLRREQESLRIAVQRQVREHVESLRVDRTPCSNCGVRADMHREFGCGRNFERQSMTRIIHA